MPDSILKILFWASIALVVHSYILYPRLMLLWRWRRDSGAHDFAIVAPTVDIVVAAHNEEAHIQARIANALGQHYSAEKLGVLIGSDGSTDRTVAEARRVEDPRVRLLAFEANRGKASVVNDLVLGSTAEVVVLSDANTEFEPDAVAMLVAHFGDPDVGAVSGELRLRRAATGTNRDHEYWSTEQALKRAESMAGALLGANGAIYAIRRRLFQVLPPDTICDDFVIAMNIASRGFKVVYEPRAIAHEDSAPQVEEEYRRRVRIGAGNYQAFFRHPEYLFRANPVRLFAYISHKVLRWFTPQLLLIALVTSACLTPGRLYAILFAVQILGYGTIAVAYLARRHVQRLPLLPSLLFVAVLNMAFLWGFWRYIRGDYRGAWRRSQR